MSSKQVRKILSSKGAQELMEQAMNGQMKPGQKAATLTAKME